MIDSLEIIASCDLEFGLFSKLNDYMKLVSAFVFATYKVLSLYFQNPKFQASNQLLWLYRPVCAGLGRKPRRFSRVED